MKPLMYLMFVSFLLVQSVRAAVKDEIAAMDATLVRACEEAEANAARSTADATKSFLRVLSLLETQFRNARDEESLLACRKARAKYDPAVEKVDQPTKDPVQLSALLAGFQRQLDSFESYKSKTIALAQERRTRNLTALQRGLTQRGDKAGAQLVCRGAQDHA